MYGLINKSIKALVISRFGEERWRAVCDKAGVEEGVFFSNESYPDAITYQLVQTAAEELGMPVADFLVAFGEHWVLETGPKYYGELLKSGGSTLREFLIRLPHFHARVQLIYPNLSPPEFVCTDIGRNSLRLHYHTQRQGLTNFVVGLLLGLGKLYKTPLRLALVESRELGADHDVFDIQWDAMPGAS